MLSTRAGTHGYAQYPYWWKEMMLAAGLVSAEGKPKFSPHALRHACVSLLVEQRVPLLEIAGLVGHKTTEMTVGIYAHLFKDAADNATPALAVACAALMPPKMPQICDSRAHELENPEDS